MIHDMDYTRRLLHHLSILVAYEDSATQIDEDQLMLALVFMQSHCAMLARELQRISVE